MTAPAHMLAAANDAWRNGRAVTVSEGGLAVGVDPGDGISERPAAVVLRRLADGTVEVVASAVGHDEVARLLGGASETP
jgi:hypothetical protein